MNRFFCHDLDISDWLLPEIGFSQAVARNYCSRCFRWISRRKRIVVVSLSDATSRALRKDCIILAAVEGLYHRESHVASYRRYFGVFWKLFGRETRFRPRKSAVAERPGASRSARNTSSCFLPDGKTARLPRRPAVFFRDRTSNNNPFLTVSKVSGADRIVFSSRYVSWSANSRAEFCCLQAVILRYDVKNYWTLSMRVR